MYNNSLFRHSPWGPVCVLLPWAPRILELSPWKGTWEPDLIQKSPCYLKAALGLLLPPHYPLHSPTSTFNQKGPCPPCVVSLSLHCPPWETPIWYLQNFRLLLASLPQHGLLLRLATTVPHNLMIMSLGGHLTDKDRCCFWGKEKKNSIIFSPRKYNILHKCYSLINIHSTHREPGDSISLDFMDGEIEPYTRSDSAAGTQSPFSHFGLQLYLISINKVLRRIWLFYFKQVSSWTQFDGFGAYTFCLDRW